MGYQFPHLTQFFARVEDLVTTVRALTTHSAAALGDQVMRSSSRFTSNRLALPVAAAS